MKKSNRIKIFLHFVFLTLMLFYGCKGFVWYSDLTKLESDLTTTYTFYADSTKSHFIEFKYITGETYSIPELNDELLSRLGKTGYDIQGWQLLNDSIPDSFKIDESGNITGYTVTHTNYSFVAKGWVGKPASYKVQYYLENADDDQFTLDETRTKEVESFVGEVISDDFIKTTYKEDIEHFTYKECISPMTVQYDNDTVINLYYMRNVLKVTVELDGGTTATVLTDNTMDVKYDARIVIDTPKKEGYTFDYWKVNGFIIDDISTFRLKEDILITACYEPNQKTVNGITITFPDIESLIPTKDVTKDVKRSDIPNGYKFEINLPDNTSYTYVWTLTGAADDTKTNESYEIDITDLESGEYELICIATGEDGTSYIAVQNFTVTKDLNLSNGGTY